MSFMTDEDDGDAAFFICEMLFCCCKIMEASDNAHQEHWAKKNANSNDTNQQAQQDHDTTKDLRLNISVEDQVEGEKPENNTN